MANHPCAAAVIANGDGTEAIITLFRPSTTDGATWARDQDWVKEISKKLAAL
jgi:hypothetical protein